MVNDSNNTVKLFMGIDVGTQSFKVCLIDEQCQLVDQFSVDYDTKLPHYKTVGGVHIHNDGKNRVTCPTIMWIEALDMCLQHFAQKRNLLSRCCAIGTSGQQHGSVYWANGCLENVLKAQLSSEKYIAESLYEICKRNEKQLFVCESPIWMDSSTSVECQQLEDAVGGAKNMIYMTGSRATERFTASQIHRFYNENRDHEFERISLISSFIPSLFLGKYADLDFSDASGMNLLDVNTVKWSNECLQATSNGRTPILSEQLGDLSPALSTLGTCSTYMQQKYGFPSSCIIVAGTGDNPSSACGTIRQKGDLVISLGTSHTVFGYTDIPALSGNQDAEKYEGHTFISPLFISESDSSVEKYMKLICFKNGANVRNKLCEEFNTCWSDLEEAVRNGLDSQRLNDNQPNDPTLGLYFLLPEITPHTGSSSGLYRCNSKNGILQTEKLTTDDALTLYESQAISLKLHAKRAGLLDSTQHNRRLIVTGGASESKSILYILAQVFGCDVYGLNVKDSAATGAAIRSLFAHNHLRDGKTAESSQYLSLLEANLPPMECLARRDERMSLWYNTVLEPLYERFEQRLIQHFSEPNAK